MNFSCHFRIFFNEGKTRKNLGNGNLRFCNELTHSVIPATAGIQEFLLLDPLLDSCLRRNDGEEGIGIRVDLF